MMKNLLTILLLVAIVPMATSQIIDHDEPRTARDIVHNDDVIITFSACVGNDCVNGENFGFDTQRLKENNLRIHFDDTSNSASFPKRDWRIVINDSSNGGDEYFAVEDATSGRQVFRIDGNSIQNALYVSSAGDVGIGTDNPVVEVHAVDGNTPTLRLEQNGSSGFTPQTWDLAGNETNFFVRDVTNGSKLPFKIRPGAPDNSIYIDTDGDVGMGTASPQSALHVDNGAEEVRLILEYDDQAIVSGGYGEAVFRESGSDKWSFGSASTTGGGRFYIFDYTNNRQVLAIDSDGDVGIGTSSSPQADLDINNGGMFSRINAGDATITTSSRRFKTNINKLEVPDILDKISNVPVTTYDWKSEYMKEGEEPRLHNIGLIAEEFHTIFANGPETQISTREVQMALWLAAQKLDENDDLLKEELEEKETRIADLENQVSELSARLDQISELLESGQQTVLLNAGELPILGQNYPNPYQNETVIEYFLPSRSGYAEFQFSDLSGKIIKRIPVAVTGKGKLNIKSHDLPQGNYQYSLIIDGQIIDTKQMILSK